MYDDDITASFGNRSFYKVAKFPTRNITAPIVLVYGGCDSLVDINIMLKELPPHTIAHEVPHFEHLDFLWGKDVKELVFPHVLDALDTYSYDPEGNDENGFIKYYQSPTGAKGNLLEPKNDAGPGRATPDSLPNYSEKGSGNDGEAPNGTTEANEQAEAELTAEEALTPMLAPVFELYEVATDLNEVTTEQILESMVEPTAADTVLPTPPPSSPLNEEVLVEALIASHHTKYPQISRESSPLSYSSTSNRRAGTPPLYAKSEPDQDSNPPTPPGLIYPPPRGPAAQNGGPLAYGSPISTKHAKSARSGSLGSLGIPDTSNRIGGGGITVGSVRPISSVTAINTVISEQNRTSPSTASGLAPPASSASSLASASASASPPSGPSFSPPTGPAADRASPPVGPRSLQKFRAGRSPYVASNSAFGANNTSFGGGRPVHHVPTNGHYQLPDEKDFSVGQRVAVHRNNRRRGRGRGRVSEIMPYRGNGEVRMGVEGSLYSDGMTVGARW